MAARIGTNDDHLFTTPRPELLREIAGIDPEQLGTHVRLDRHAGVRSAQRLALADVGGGIVAALWPAELVPQARYLYGGERAGALIAAARANRWSVEARPHLAFHTSPPSRRLYLDPQVEVDEYARRWEGVDAARIRQYSSDEVSQELWPWLKQRHYASPGDDEVLDAFLALLGRRAAHLRPALRLLRRWDAREAGALRASGELVAAIRRAVNGVLAVADEPTLPVGST